MLVSDQKKMHCYIYEFYSLFNPKSLLHKQSFINVVKMMLTGIPNVEHWHEREGQKITNAFTQNIHVPAHDLP